MSSSIFGIIGATDSNRQVLKKSVLNRTDGQDYVVICNPNDPASLNGDQSNVDKFEVYQTVPNEPVINFPVQYHESDRKILVTPTVAVGPAGSAMSADMYADGSIGIVYVASDKSIRLIKINTTTWTATQELAVSAISGWFFRRIDVSMSDGGAVAVCAFALRDDRQQHRINLYVKKPSGAWSLAYEGALGSITVRNYSEDVAVSWVKGGTSAARDIFWARAVTSTAQDYGTFIYSGVMNEEGSISDVVTRGTIAANLVPHTVNFATKVREVFIWPSATDEVTIAVGQTFGTPDMTVQRWRKISGVWQERIPATTHHSGFNTAQSYSNVTLTYGSNVVAYFFNVQYPGSSNSHPYDIVSYTHILDNDLVNWSASGRPFDNLERAAYNAVGGTGRNTSNKRHGIIFMQRTSQSDYELFHHHALKNWWPVNLVPSEGSTVTTSEPAVRADISLPVANPPSAVRIEWEFALDPFFTTSVRSYKQPFSKEVYAVGTDDPSVIIRVNDVLPESQALTQGVWYVRARHVDRFQIAGQWSNPPQFTVSHPPAASNLSPSAGVMLTPVVNEVAFSWHFTDPYTKDQQSAFEIIVEDDATGTAVYNSGKVLSAEAFHVGAIPLGSFETLLRWRVRLWDEDDIVGAYSPYATFLVAGPPTAVIDSPTSGGVVTSAVPSVTFTPTVGSGRTITSFRVSITQGPDEIFNSGKMLVSLESGQQYTWTATSTILENSESYSYSLTLTDSANLTSTTAPVPVTTAWVVPDGPQGLAANTLNFNVENEGFVEVAWNDVARDIDFSFWVVYRKDDLINPNTMAVLEEGEWKEIAREYFVVDNYSYHDYYAPSGYKSNYRVRQVVNRFGEDIESDNVDFVSVYPVSEGYWLIEVGGPDLDADAFRLHNVTADDFTDEYEEAEYTIIGRGRHIDRGDRLGFKGSLTAQIRDSGGITARQKKLRLERLKSENRNLSIRTPFGDIFSVYIGNIGISRIAGVGTSEFVDVTLPYSEVAQ